MITCRHSHRTPPTPAIFPKQPTMELSTLLIITAVFIGKNHHAWPFGIVVTINRDQSKQNDK